MSRSGPQLCRFFPFLGLGGAVLAGAVLGGPVLGGTVLGGTVLGGTMVGCVMLGSGNGESGATTSFWMVVPGSSSAGMNSTPSVFPLATSLHACDTARLIVCDSRGSGAAQNWDCWGRGTHQPLSPSCSPGIITSAGTPSSSIELKSLASDLADADLRIMESSAYPCFHSCLS